MDDPSGPTPRPVAAELATQTRERPLPGTGRLGVTSAFFTLTSAGGVLGTLMAGSALVSSVVTNYRLPSLGFVHQVALMTGVTISAFMTSHFLDRRSRLGAVTASIFFAIGLATYARGGAGILTLGISIVGLGLVASVWRHLD